MNRGNPVARCVQSPDRLVLTEQSLLLVRECAATLDSLVFASRMLQQAALLQRCSGRLQGVSVVLRRLREIAGSGG